MDTDGRPKGDHALQRVLITVGEVDKLLMLFENRATGMDKLLAELGAHQLSGGAQEYGQTDFPLHAGQRPRNVRLGHIQALGRPADAGGFGDSADDPQLIHFKVFQHLIAA